MVGKWSYILIQTLAWPINFNCNVTYYLRRTYVYLHLTMTLIVCSCICAHYWSFLSYMSSISFPVTHDSYIVNFAQKLYHPLPTVVVCYRYFCLQLFNFHIRSLSLPACTSVINMKTLNTTHSWLFIFMSYCLVSRLLTFTESMYYIYQLYTQSVKKWNRGLCKDVWFF